MKYVVELNDVDGKHFQIEMHLPWVVRSADPGNTTWKALDEGFIKYHSGGCESEKSAWTGPVNIYLLFGGPTWGIKFSGFFDSSTLVNSSGSGEIMQPWVVSFKPGTFGWTLIS